MKKSKKAMIIAFWTLASITLLLPVTAKAISVYDPSESLGYSSSDLQTTVVNVVKWALGLLALVAVIMIIIGGFQWMMAGGNEEKVEKAKKLISAAVIGLIIVLLAWAIVIFVVGVASNASET